MANAIATMGLDIAKGVTSIINVTGVDYSGLQGFVMETTNLSSTNGLKTYETSGVFEPGELQLSFNYDPSDTTHTAIVTDCKDGSTDAYTVTFSNSDTLVADCIVTSFEWTGQKADDGKHEATATLKLAGTNITDPS